MKRTCVVCGREFDHTPVPGRPPVTCSPDCQRIRKLHKTYESRDRFADIHVPADKHGTSTGYVQYQCGCKKCTTWARRYKQAWRWKRREEHT